MVPFDLLLAFSGFAFASSITPGPNNIMLMTSGVNFGFNRSIRHIAGVVAGFYVMLLLVGFGVGQLLQANPDLYLALKILSVVYLLWLAWRVANSGAVKPQGGEERARPINFLEAALFQWVNPKAWTMAITTAAAYTVPDNYESSLLVICTVFVIVGAPCMIAWNIFGVGMRSFLQNQTRVRVFNITMAVLLVLSFLPVVLGVF